MNSLFPTQRLAFPTDPQPNYLHLSIENPAGPRDLDNNFHAAGLNERQNNPSKEVTGKMLAGQWAATQKSFHAGRRGVKARMTTAGPFAPRWRTVRCCVTERGYGNACVAPNWDSVTDF